MIDDVTFREARADDACGIGAVHVASWQSAYAGLLPRTVLEEQDVDTRARFRKRCLAGAESSASPAP